MVRRRGSYSWRCPSKGCQTFTSVRNNSFFSRSHLKLDVIVELLYFWSKQVRVMLPRIRVRVKVRVRVQSKALSHCRSE